MAFDIKKPISKASRFEALRAAAIAAISPVENSDSTAISKEKRLVSPSDCSERIRVVFDDSGSMSGASIREAKEGCVEFLRNCIPGQTAVAIHLMNPKDQRYLDPLIMNAELSSDLIKIASSIAAIEAPGGTPLFPTILRALRATPCATRLIAFSDGSPDTQEEKERAISLANKLKIPIDTVFIDGGYSNSAASALMKEIADRTGGYFLDLQRGSSFKNAFKYLAPINRLRLSDGNFRALLEGR